MPWLFGAAFSFLSFILALILMEDYTLYAREGVGKINIMSGLRKMRQVARDSFAYSLKNKAVYWLITSSVITLFSFQALNMFWSPRFEQFTGGKVYILGWLWVGFASSIILGSYISKKYTERYYNFTPLMLVMVFILSLPILVTALSETFYLVALMFAIYEIGRGIDKPIKTAYLNRYIPSDKRATILSFDSMMSRFGAALGLIVMGAVVKYTSIQLSWLLSALIMLTLIPIYIKVGYHERVT